MDLIDRQAAIDAIAFDKEMLNRVLDDMDVVGVEREKFAWGLGLIESLIDDIGELPSVQPEPKTGRRLDTYNDGDWHCSECGAIVEKDEQIRHYWQRCYHCGAKMGGEQE